MQTRTRNALALVAFAVVAAAALIAVWRLRRGPSASVALDGVPAGALLVATADLAALRGSPVGGRFLREGREIPGMGKVRDVCGFDPLDVLTDVAVAIPAGGDEGDFGVVGAGPIDDEAVLSCASKVIAARGGKPVVTAIGSFRSVRDADLPGSGGEIAVRKGGPLLLGAGAYLRAMIDAADGRTPNIRSSVAHMQLAGVVGEGAIRASIVLTPEQRRTIATELRTAGGDRGAVGGLEAAAFSMRLGADLAFRSALACDDPRAATALAEALGRARAERAADPATRVLGLGGVLDRLEIVPRDELVLADVNVPVDEAAVLVDRVLTLRGFRHPTPALPQDGEMAPLPSGEPSPDEVVRPDGGVP
ncbi:MAG: hypothetical protein WKG00_05895 [Polyangiaceae bacterium]